MREVRTVIAYDFFLSFIGLGDLSEMIILLGDDFESRVEGG